MAESNAETSRKGKSGEHVVRMGEWSGVGDSQQIKTSTPRKLFSTDFFFMSKIGSKRLNRNALRKLTCFKKCFESKNHSKGKNIKDVLGFNIFIRVTRH